MRRKRKWENGNKKIEFNDKIDLNFNIFKSDFGMFALIFSWGCGGT